MEGFIYAGIKYEPSMDFKPTDPGSSIDRVALVRA